MVLNKKFNKIQSFSVDEYDLIYHSEKMDKLSKYKMVREEERIRFTTTGGYTLFFLAQVNGEIVLQGLDGYGMRDKEFGNFLKQLISEFKRMDNKDV